MPEHFLNLSTKERRDILAVAQTRTGKNTVVMEKDVWLCWTLAELFSMPNGPRMVFKGGTSLSKVFDLIGRFSEDVDVTLDYRSLLPPTFDPFDPKTSKTKIRRYSDELREAVGVQVETVIAPHLQARAIAEFGANAVQVDVVKDDGEWIEKAVLRYPTVAEGKLAYISPAVILEFGGRNVTEPSKKHRVAPDIAADFATLTWPEAFVEVLDPERTFWETEIASLYADNPDGIVTWAKAPGKKRPDMPQMPPFASVGEPKLRQIADSMLQVGRAGR
jgi:Nucleotidyl transferase AbiEii toxin, Type IV TA system